MLKATERLWSLWAPPSSSRTSHLGPKSDQTLGPYEDHIHGDNQGQLHPDQAWQPGYGQSKEGTTPHRGIRKSTYFPWSRWVGPGAAQVQGWCSERADVDTKVESNWPQVIPGTVSRNNEFLCLLSCFSHVGLFAMLRTVACQAPLSMDSTGKGTGKGCHALLQGIFRTRDRTQISYISCIGRQVLYRCATWEAHEFLNEAKLSYLWRRRKWNSVHPLTWALSNAPWPSCHPLPSFRVQVIQNPFPSCLNLQAIFILKTTK